MLAPGFQNWLCGAAPVMSTASLLALSMHAARELDSPRAVVP